MAPGVSGFIDLAVRIGKPIVYNAAFILTCMMGLSAVIPIKKKLNNSTAVLMAYISVFFGVLSVAGLFYLPTQYANMVLSAAPLVIGPSIAGVFYYNRQGRVKV